MWPGDTGTVHWMISNNNPTCALTDSTHITLHRPWPGQSGTYGFTSYNLVGSGSQPFMIGIKALQMRYGGQVYTPYQALDVAAANWVGTTGFIRPARVFTTVAASPCANPPSPIAALQIRCIAIQTA
jgi:hypothetical protein